MSHNSSSSTRSSRVASPWVILFKMRYICAVPTRQGIHLPQDSVIQKSMKYLATSTMHDVSSITIMPPEPLYAPASDCDAESPGSSRCASDRQPPDGPQA